MDKSMCISVFCSALPFFHPHLSPLPLGTHKVPDTELPTKKKAKGRSTNQINEEGRDFTTLLSVRTSALLSKRGHATILFPFSQCLMLLHFVNTAGASL